VGSSPTRLTLHVTVDFTPFLRVEIKFKVGCTSKTF